MSELIYKQDAIDAIANTIVRGESLGDGIAEDILYSVPSAELERHYCRECKWSRCHINLDKYGRSETYWHCLNWDGETDEEGFCHEWERIADEQTD